MPGTTAERGRRVSGGLRTGILLLGVFLAGVGLGVGTAAASDHENATVAATFEATGVEGFVAINQTNAADPIAFPTPDEVEQPISVDGVVYTNGTWRSTDVSFPNLGEEQLGFDIEIRLEAPRPFEGEFDRETGEMTADAALTIIVPVGDEELEIDVRANLTTGQSNGIQGDSEGLATDNATVTLVNNQFTVPEQTGNTLIDNFIGLPAPDPGTNWFSLDLAMDIETNTGALTGVVESPAGDPVEGATVTAGGQTTTTDAGGAYEVEVPVGGANLTVEQFGFANRTRSVTVDSGETTTADITLDPVETGTVAGVVTSVSGGPVSGATVTVGNRETTTETDGTYELDAEAGTAELTIMADGFDETSRSVAVTADQVSTVDVEVGSSVATFEPVLILADDTTVGESVEVTGLVQNVGTATGITEVTVAVGDESVTETVELAPDGLRAVTLDWETVSGDEGSYEATVTTGNGTERRSVVVAGPSFNLSVSANDVAPNGTVTATATVENTGTVGGSREVTVAILDDGVVETVTETVTLGPGETGEVTLDWETTANDAGSYELRAEAGDEVITGSVLVDDSVGEADFVIESTGGYMAYGYDTLEAAEGQGLEFPDKNAGEDPIRIWGVIDEETGTWESVREEFPTLVQRGLEGTVETIDGLSGEIDRDTGFLTATATYRVVIEGDEDTAFEFNMTMTTGESGEMTDIGAYEPVNDTFVNVTFVSNDFAVDDRTGDSLADSTLKLPSPQVGDNYVELGFQADFDPGEQPVPTDNTSTGNPADDDGGETEPSGQTLATVGQGVGVLGLVGALLAILAGLYVRFVRAN